jgi:hypothetical protein
MPSVPTPAGHARPSRLKAFGITVVTLAVAIVLLVVGLRMMWQAVGR